MYDSYFENLDQFSFVPTKNDNTAFSKICTQRTVSKKPVFLVTPKRLFCAAFSAPDPPGGLSMRTRRLWDRGFEVLDFRTSARFRFKSNLEDPLLKALNHLNLQSLTLRQEQVNAIRNVVDKSEMTGSPISLGLQILRPPRQSFLVLVLKPPGGSKNENVCVDEQTKGSIVP